MIFNDFPTRAGRWRVAGLLLAMLVIVALPYVVTRISSNDAIASAGWVTHSAEVKGVTYRIAYVARDSESATFRRLQGYEDKQVTERIESARTELPNLLGELRDLTADNPDQRALIGALESALNGRVALLTQALDLHKRGDAAGVATAMRSSGKLFRVHDLIQHVVENEDNLLSERQRKAEAERVNNVVVLRLGAAAQIILLSIIVIVSEGQIAQRVRAERRVRQATKRSHMIVQAVREPIALLDEQLSTLLINAAFSEMYGVPQEESRKLQPLAGIGNGAWADSALQQRLRDVMARDRELWDYELVQRTVDEVDRYVVINARRLQKDETDAPTLLLTVSDVTARALVEREVNNLNRQLEGKVEQISDVNRELEAFSYSVSHDLRAPLRHVAGFASKLAQHLGDQVDDKSRHYLDTITTSAQRMAQLIDDLLVFSRLGRGALRLQATDMQSMVDEARAQAQSEAEAEGRRIVWTVGQMPMVVGDENMLRTVWQNLIGNAVKYTGKCEVARIGINVERTASGEYQFNVTDNGAGFDMDYAGKLFGVFQRLHRASDFPGNGIGLANVRRIIARHGGRTWAEAEPDKGARFHFTLPVSTG